MPAAVAFSQTFVGQGSSRASTSLSSTAGDKWVVFASAAPGVLSDMSTIALSITDSGVTAPGGWTSRGEATGQHANWGGNGAHRLWVADASGVAGTITVSAAGIQNAAAAVVGFTVFRVSDPGDIEGSYIYATPDGGTDPGDPYEAQYTANTLGWTPSGTSLVLNMVAATTHHLWNGSYQHIAGTGWTAGPASVAQASTLGDGFNYGAGATLVMAGATSTTGLNVLRWESRPNGASNQWNDLQTGIAAISFSGTATNNGTGSGGTSGGTATGTVTTPNSTANAVDDVDASVRTPGASFVIDVSLNDTACSGGDTAWELIPGSAVNATVVNPSPDSAPTATDEQFNYSWKPVRLGGGGNVSGLDIANDGTVVNRIDVYGGYVLPAGSTTWQQLVTRSSMPTSWRQPKLGKGLYAVAVAPSNSQRIYMAFAGHVFASSDQGATFTQTAFAPANWDSNGAFSRGFGEKMAVDPANPDVVLAAGPDTALRMSVDGGATWTTTTVPAGLAQPYIDASYNDIASVGITGIVYDRTSTVTGGRTQTVYAASWGRGVYRSTNGGTTWSLLAGSPTHIVHAAIDAAGAYYVVTGDKDSDYTVQRFSGGTWTTITPPGWNPGSIASVENPMLTASPQTAGLVIVAYAGQMFLSRDSGTSWTAATWSDGSGDVTWEDHSTTNYYLVCSDMQFDPSTSNRVWMATGSGVQYADVPTTGATMTWHERTFGMETMVATDSSSTLGGGPVFGVFDFGVFAGGSDLDAITQTKGPVDFFSGTTSVASSPFTAGYVVNVCTDYVRHGVYPVSSAYSTDSGATWTIFPDLPGSGTNAESFGYGAIAVSNAGNIVWAPGRYYPTTATSFQPYYTTDHGATWSPVVLPGVTSYPADSIGGFMFGRNRHAVTADEVNPGTFYLTMVGEGVFRSTDGGATWARRSTAAQLSAGDQSYSIKIGAIPGKAGGLLFADGGSGGHNWQGGQQHAGGPLRRSNDGGATWADVPNVDKVLTFGFGAPKPGNTIGSIYVAGDVGGVYGIWRSDDDCATWTQIGDYPYVLDWVTAIEGDRNTYGRAYVGFQGSSWAYGDPITTTTPTTPATAGTFTVTPTADGAWSFQYRILCGGQVTAETATVSGFAGVVSDAGAGAAVSDGTAAGRVVVVNFRGTGAGAAVATGTAAGAVYVVRNADGTAAATAVGTAVAPEPKSVAIGEGTAASAGTAVGSIPVQAFGDAVSAGSALASVAGVVRHAASGQSCYVTVPVFSDFGGATPVSPFEVVWPLRNEWGRMFAGPAELDAFLEENYPRLRWNAALGRVDGCTIGVLPSLVLRSSELPPIRTDGIDRAQSSGLASGKTVTLVNTAALGAAVSAMSGAGSAQAFVFDTASGAAVSDGMARGFAAVVTSAVGGAVSDGLAESTTSAVVGYSVQSNGASASVTFPTVAGETLLVVGYTARPGESAPFSMSVSGGPAWTSRGVAQESFSIFQRLSAGAWTGVAAGGSTTVSVSAGGGSSADVTGIAVYRVRGTYADFSKIEVGDFGNSNNGWSMNVTNSLFDTTGLLVVSTFAWITSGADVSAVSPGAGWLEAFDHAARASTAGSGAAFAAAGSTLRSQGQWAESASADVRSVVGGDDWVSALLRFGFIPT